MEYTQILKFIVILTVCYTFGNLLRRYLESKNVKGINKLGTVEASLLGLFAFFLGFTFNISASKMETVRQTSVVEANAIGTALLRTQMYSPEEQSQYTQMFKSYLKERIAYFSQNTTPEESKDEFDKSNELGNDIFSYTLKLAENKENAEKSRLMIPAVNDMIDSVTSRESAINATLPKPIINTLYFLCICSCIILGFSMEKVIYSNLTGIIYILAISVTITLILDAGNPRTGLINTDKANQLIVDIYNGLN